jgi:hypothetical protein
MMKEWWKQQFTKIAIWVVTEILLSLIGLDTLADYSEFVFEQKEVSQVAVLLSHCDKSIASLSSKLAIAPTLA